MSNKKNVKPAPTAKSVDADEVKRLDRTRLFLVIFAAVAVLTIVASIIIAVVASSNKQFDYMKKNLARYVEISEEDYKNYTVEIDSEQLERDVKTTIMQILYERRTAPAKDEYTTGVTVSAGDEVKIFYRGYTLGKNNEKNYFNGGCNFGSDEPNNLVIGKGEFVEGFEFNLIGKNQNDHATLERFTTGELGDLNLIYLTYTAAYADGTNATEAEAIIDLSDPNLDEKWGEGFAAYFRDNVITIGEEFATGDEAVKLPTIKPGEGNAENDVYTDMKVVAACRVNATEEKPVLEVEAYFPEDYRETTLRGKTAMFEVYISEVKDYSVPEITEDFLTEKLGILMSELEGLEGDNLEEKYENYVRKQHVDARVDDVLWAHLIAKTTVKKLPKSEVQYYYDNMLYEIETMYPQYQSNFASFDSFARAYLELSINDDWKAALTKKAETAVVEKLVFYYIIREEGYLPSDEEYKVIYQSGYEAAVQSYLNYYGITKDSADYEAQLAIAKATIDSYTEDYWRGNILYDYGVEELHALATIVYK